MTNISARDVPSPADFHDPGQAHAWVVETIARRPSRPRFFDAFAARINAHFREPVRVAELGSGPGHLASAILYACNVENYVAIDFYPAMHAIAGAHLGNESERVSFHIADCRSPDWPDAVGNVDALVTMQAAHEVRHRDHLPALLKTIHRAIRPDGLLLFCDHYAEPGSTKNPALYLTREEQPEFILKAGFEDVTRVHEEGGMALHAALRRQR